MTEREWLIRNNKEMGKLTEGWIKNPPKTRNEKDILNLKILLYSIRFKSYSYNRGAAKTLKRVIKMIEAQNDA